MKKECRVMFDREQGVGTCVGCGRNFECGATEHRVSAKGIRAGHTYHMANYLNKLNQGICTMPTKQEVYHSSTLGPIPLSFTGRRLLQNLREAFQELLQKRVEQTKRGQVGGKDDWTAVSEARGKIAKYISELEKRPVPWSMDPELVSLRHENEVLRKANEAFKSQEKRQNESHGWTRRFAKVPLFALVNELFDRGKNVNVRRDLGNHTINITGAVDEATAQRIAEHVLQRDKEKRNRENERIVWPMHPDFSFRRPIVAPLINYKKKYQVRDAQPTGLSNFICVLDAMSMDEALIEAMKVAGQIAGYELKKRSDYEVRLLED